MSDRATTDLPRAALTVAEVAEQLQVSHTHVHDLLLRGLLRGGKSGSRWLILPGEPERYVARLAAEAEREREARRRAALAVQPPFPVRGRRAAG